MKNFEDIQEIIKNSINNLDFNLEPRLLYEPIEYILSIGGKRLRPSLVLMACNLFTKNIENAIYPAMATEVFHNFTLLHDDIMDKSDMRRNKMTVHKKWNENIAILSGDAMFIKSMQLALKTEEKYLKSVLDIFTKTALEVCEGQQYDMDFETKNDVSEKEYLKMIILKTAVLIAFSLKLGGIIGGASKKDLENLYNLGINIGISFQLQDDFLDVYGDVKVFGKKIGNDIVSNKKTYLLIKSLELADYNKKIEIIKLLSEENFDNNEKIEKITNIYNSLEIKELTQKKIKYYFKNGISFLKNINVSENKKTELMKILKKLINRNY